MEKRLIPLSYIAEYSYCPRSSYYLLIETPILRDENTFIQSGRKVHEKVDKEYSRSKNGAIYKSSVRVFSSKLGISGRIDVLEFQDKFISPVEFKRGKSRDSKMHKIQLALIALCLKEMYPEKNIKNGYIFFSEDKVKKEVKLDDELLDKAKNIAIFIQDRNKKMLNPQDFPMNKTSGCKGCCFYDLCFS